MNLLTKKIFRPAARLLLVLACTSASGQTPPFTNAILWKVQKTDSSRPSYILGSCHLLDTAKLHFPVDTIFRLISETGCMAVEITGMTNSANRDKLTEYVMVREEGRSLKKELGKSDYRKLKKRLKSAGYKLPGFILNRFNPQFWSYVIALSKYTGDPKAQNFTMDLTFEDYARKRYYPVTGLETVDQQLAWLFPVVSYDSSIAMLREVLHTAENDTMSSKVLYDYIRQDIHWGDDDTSTGTDFAKWHGRRNIGMARGIDSVMQICSVFVVIGAAHLPYKDGVLQLLYEKGYILTPVRLGIVKKTL
jgi:uncharacterized protein YbaP (TraB family)